MRLIRGPKMKLNKIIFWKEIVECLKNKKNNLHSKLKNYYTNEYFESFKENQFTDWGKICMALNEAEEELQKLYDILEEGFKK